MAKGVNIPFPQTLLEAEQEAVAYALRYFMGHRVRASKALDMPIRTLRYKIRQWGWVDEFPAKNQGVRK